MTANNLLDVINNAIESMKALDVLILDVKEQTSITDTMFICTGTSNRQVKSISQKIIEDAKHQGFDVLGVEGLDQAQWVLIDLGDAIVHVMHPDSRNYYQLEKLWSVDAKSDESLSSS